MKAIRKVDGKIIEVEIYMLNSRRDKNGLWESSYKDNRSGLVYEASDLDFTANKAKDADGEVIRGWVARDKKDNSLNLHAEEPYRTKSGYQTDDKPDWWDSECASFLPLDKGLFPDLTWDSEPMEVEIIIKPKKKSI